jgi:KaiC/GvpD/RAD55 family RecA-like ATPase
VKDLRVSAIPYDGLAGLFYPAGLRLVEKSAGALPTTSVLVRGAAGTGKSTLSLAIAQALAKASHGIALYVSTETSLADPIDKASVLGLDETSIIPYAAEKPLPEGAVALAHLVVQREEALEANPSRLAKLAVEYTYDLVSARCADAPVRAVVIDSFELPEGDAALSRSDLAAFVQGMESLGVSPVFVEEVGATTSERLTFVVDLVFQLALGARKLGGAADPQNPLRKTLTVLKSRYAHINPGPYTMQIYRDAPIVIAQ